MGVLNFNKFNYYINNLSRDVEINERMSGGFDPCECAFSQEAAMRRLLSLLRQSQSYCTDTECENLPTLPDSAGATDMTSNYMMFFGIFFALIMMFYMRPAALRRQAPQPGKPDRAPHDPNDEGPGPSGIS